MKSIGTTIVLSLTPAGQVRPSLGKTESVAKIAIPFRCNVLACGTHWPYACLVGVKFDQSLFLLGKQWLNSRNDQRHLHI